MDVFKLDDQASDKLDSWFDGLVEAVEFTGCPVEPRIRSADRAAWAAWTGKPFVLAGNAESLKKWFDSQDATSVDVILNHSLYWVLTSPKGFRHKLISDVRLTVLDWSKPEYNVISEAVSLLHRFPLLAGLSNEMQDLREQIFRIGSGRSEPGTPVLILGESGAGKEGVARSLFEVSSRPANPGLFSIGGAWLEMDAGLALSELFGIEKNRATGVDEHDGLVQQYSEGAIFIDDFEAAPKLLQERFLRIASTPKGKRAEYWRTGTKETRDTNVWLIFSTNGDVPQMVQSGQLRIDFLFRFEDRVIVVPPLRARPADVPAIAHHIWNQLVASADGLLGDRVLPWRSLKDLNSRKLEWKGNVRELAALLRLVASMCRVPRYRHEPTSDLIRRVLAKGPGYFEWFGILASKEYSAPPADPVAEFRVFDNGPVSDGLFPCERHVKAMAGERAWEILGKIIQRFKARHGTIRRKFCKYLAFADKHGSLTDTYAMQLSGVGSTQVHAHLKLLTDPQTPFLVQVNSSSKTSYEPGSLLRAGRDSSLDSPPAPPK